MSYSAERLVEANDIIMHVIMHTNNFQKLVSEILKYLNGYIPSIIGKICNERKIDIIYETLVNST